jgi:hypothetical protein
MEYLLTATTDIALRLKTSLADGTRRAILGQLVCADVARLRSTMKIITVLPA